MTAMKQLEKRRESVRKKPLKGAVGEAFAAVGEAAIAVTSTIGLFNTGIALVTDELVASANEDESQA